MLERTRLCPPYQRAKEENNTLSEQLRQELEDPAQNLWIELDLLWEDLEYGLALEAFHLGYRAALHTLKAAVGHDAVTGMLHDILLTGIRPGRPPDQHGAGADGCRRAPGGVTAACKAP